MSEPLALEVPARVEVVDLAARFRAGEPAAVEAIVRRYEPRIARLLGRLLGWQDADVPDLVQEVFVSAIDRRAQLRDLARLEGWLVRIAVNHSRATLRRRALWRAVVARFVREEASSGRDPADADERAELVRRAVAELPRGLREVLVLRELEALPAREVAAILGLRVGTVDVRLSRARQALRERLGGLIEE